MRTVGPFQILKKIAFGGAAEIYLARGGGFAEPVALKMLLPHLQDDEMHRKMMRDEAELTAQLVHPNIVRVHSLGEDNGQLYVVMEHLDGLNVAQMLEQTRQRGLVVPIEVAVFITHEVASALYYAHTRATMEGAPLDLVHRDISPQNIVVGRDGGVKVIDFGVAKATYGDRIETKTGIIKGKFTYMSPEYATGSLQDHRSDIFATGLCLYEMLVGRAAYDIENPYQMVEAVRNARLDQPSRVRPDVDPTLERILARAVEHKPHNRWSTALEFQVELNNYLQARAPGYNAGALAAWLTYVMPPHDGQQHHAPPPPHAQPPPQQPASLDQVPTMMRNVATPPPAAAPAPGPRPASDLTTAEQQVLQRRRDPGVTASGERHIPGLRPPDDTPDSGIFNRVFGVLLFGVALVVVVWLAI